MQNQYLPGVITIPSALIITGMTRSCPMTITFTVPDNASNTYQPGMLVKLFVPRTWGMYQADNAVVKILTVGATTMTVNIDSTQFDTFVDGSASAETPASLAPFGSSNVQYDNTTNVAFKSLNNIGN